MGREKFVWNRTKRNGVRVSLVCPSIYSYGYFTSHKYAKLFHPKYINAWSWLYTFFTTGIGINKKNLSLWNALSSAQAYCCINILKRASVKSKHTHWNFNVLAYRCKAALLLFLTCRDTYLALNDSTIALDAWSINFCARPNRRCERFTACDK